MVKKYLVPAALAGVIGVGALAEIGPASPASASGPNAHRRSNGPKADRTASARSQTARATAAANAFLATLTAEQKTKVLYAFDSTAKQSGWSNLPTTFVTRNGLSIADLTTTQVAALGRLLQAGLSSTGYSQEEAIRVADQYLHDLQSTTSATTPTGTTPTGTTPVGTTPTGTTPVATTPRGTTPMGTTPGGPGGGTGGFPGGGAGGGVGADDYGAGKYYIALFGTPSKSNKWTMQFGGHHLAVNLTFAGAEVSGTPYFIGVEPTSFVVASKTYEPLSAQATGMKNLFASLTSTQLETAKLGTSFDDVLVGPGKDGQFPTREGQAVSELSRHQQALVTKAIEAWVSNVNTPAARKILAEYRADYRQTKISWATSTDPGVQGAYFRIDGPRVWIEMVSQGGIVVRDQVHYHTIWRDRVSDYGAN